MVSEMGKQLIESVAKTAIHRKDNSHVIKIRLKSLTYSIDVALNISSAPLLENNFPNVSNK